MSGSFHHELWAKARPEAEQRARFHPLICHLVDVAVVAREIWESCLSAPARRRIAAGLGQDEAAASAWIACLGGLHDIGKASPAFQRQDAAALERLRAAGWSRSSPRAWG